MWFPSDSAPVCSDFAVRMPHFSISQLQSILWELYYFTQPGCQTTRVHEGAGSKGRSQCKGQRKLASTANSSGSFQKPQSYQKSHVLNVSLLAGKLMSARSASWWARSSKASSFQDCPHRLHLDVYADLACRAICEGLAGGVVLRPPGFSLPARERAGKSYWIWRYSQPGPSIEEGKMTGVLLHPSGSRRKFGTVYRECPFFNFL